MINSGQRLTCAAVKAWDMVNYLSVLGFEPAKVKGNDYWYLSPFRKERTASFKINRAINRWYDHGIGKGGNLIDFGTHFHGCTVKSFLAGIPNTFSSYQPSLAILPSATGQNKIIVLNDYPIASAHLVEYLKQRHIPVAIADKYCREIRYQCKEKIYLALGFKNDAGGYELRNQFCKNSSAPKAITTLKNGAEKLAVFEGFFDFLSFIVLHQHQPSVRWDFCILNSLSFFGKTTPLLQQYDKIHLFLDNDQAGQNCSMAALQQDKKYIIASRLFDGYKDLNEWLVAKNKLKQKKLLKSRGNILSG